MTTIKKSLTMDLDVIKIVDDLRSKERPIKSFSNMTCKLVKRGASFYKIPKKEVIKARVGGVEEVSDFEEITPSKPVEADKGIKYRSKKKRDEPKTSRVETKVLLRFCDFCGSDLPDDFGKFCDKCGRKLI